MVLLDSNIFIYLANGNLVSESVANHVIAHAGVSEIESLGFAEIHANELLLLKALFTQSYKLSLTDEIIKQAVSLRQVQRMSLGDAIVAGTALVHQLELWTANTRDFSHIENLKLVNPCNV